MPLMTRVWLAFPKAASAMGAGIARDNDWVLPQMHLKPYTSLNDDPLESNQWGKSLAIALWDRTSAGELAYSR